MSVPRIEVGNAIEAVIRKAADRTGVDFGFLLKTAKRESSLNPKAKAGTSSAAGLFQFVEQTWLGQIKQHGAKHGYGRYASMIEKGSDGRLRCTSDQARRAVMDMRFDPSCSSLMAGELASDHAAYLKGRIGREATGGELYAAHFLGPKGAAKLIEANGRSPEASAASLFPQAAAANRSIFSRKGRPATVAEVYAKLTRASGGEETSESARIARSSTIALDKPAYRLLGDMGEKRNAAYALQERLDRMRQEQSLVATVLDRSQSRGVGDMFSAEMLAVLAGSDREHGDN